MKTAKENESVYRRSDRSWNIRETVSPLVPEHFGPRISGIYLYSFPDQFVWVAYGHHKDSIALFEAIAESCSPGCTSTGGADLAQRGVLFGKRVCDYTTELWATGYDIMYDARRVFTFSPTEIEGAVPVTRVALV